MHQHRQRILDEFFDMPVHPPNHSEFLDVPVDPPNHSSSDFWKEPFWKPAASAWREKQDRRSLSKINISILENKIESMELMRDRICKGIKDLEGLFAQSIYLGGGSAGTGCFLFFQLCFDVFFFCFFAHDLAFLCRL